jgi:hypothetical protein
MFGLIWGPTLAAVSVVLDNASDPAVVARALECLQLAARMAAYHQVRALLPAAAAEQEQLPRCAISPSLATCMCKFSFTEITCTVLQRTSHQLCALARCTAQVDEVVDSIAASLARFTAVLAPPNGAAAFGGSSKARGALQALFAVANRCATAQLLCI